jgi:hypothetical protein
MKICLEHAHCNHAQPICQCSACWQEKTQCPYFVDLCDHHMPDYIECKACENAERPTNIDTPSQPMDVDEPTNNVNIDYMKIKYGDHGSPMDLNRPTSPQTDVANNKDSTRNTNMDSTTAIHHTSHHEDTPDGNTGGNISICTRGHCEQHPYIYLRPGTSKRTTVSCTNTINDKQEDIIPDNKEHIVPINTETYSGISTDGDGHRGLSTHESSDSTSDSESSNTQLSSINDRGDHNDTPHQSNDDNSIPSPTRTTQPTRLRRRRQTTFFEFVGHQ